MENEEQVFKLADFSKQRERILVIGVGGGGGNALNHIIRSNVEGVEYVAANTDARALNDNEAPVKIVLGEKLTKGLGAGSDPTIGADAAKESLERLKDHIIGADMVFITAGMGGGTGTGASPIIAEVARELGALVVGVVTTPFNFEMKTRFKIAQQGIKNLEDKVDALLVIENEKLLTLSDEKTEISDSYRLADDVLRQAVQGVTDLIIKPGRTNVDFADIRTVMRNAGTAIMGIGYGEGPDRAELAVKAAIKSPLMSVSMKGAKGVLFNISGSSNITTLEVSKIANVIRDTADEDAMVIYGLAIDGELNDSLRITVIATGFSRKDAPIDTPRVPIAAAEPVSRVAVPTIGKVRSLRSPVSIDDADLLSSSQLDEDFFTLPGLPKNQYDVPAILRKQQRRR